MIILGLRVAQIIILQKMLVRWQHRWDSMHDCLLHDYSPFIEEDQNLTNGNIVRVGYCENASSDFLSALFLIKTDMRNKIVQCSFKFSHWTLSFYILEKMCRYFCLLTFNSFFYYVLNSPIMRTKVKHKL